jgi:hypothetical protein
MNTWSVKYLIANMKKTKWIQGLPDGPWTKEPDKAE